MPKMKTSTSDPEFQENLELHLSEVARRNAISHLETQLGLRYSRERAKLRTYMIYDSAQKQVKQRLVSIATELQTFIDAGKNLVWYGNAGTGKDHLLAAMLYAAANLGINAEWVHCQSFFGQSRDRISADKSQEPLIRQLASPHVLGMSDPVPPKGETKTWDIQLLYRVLDARNRSMKLTWVTVNAKDETELMEELSMPVWDRIREGAELFPCFWESYRGRKS